MSKIKWREVLKFLSGAAFAGAITNFYLAVHNIAVPFLGYTISPRLLAARGAAQFVFFVVFFYFGYTRRGVERQHTRIKRGLVDAAVTQLTDRAASYHGYRFPGEIRVTLSGFTIGSV